MATGGEQWHAMLRDKGYRLTPQRELVLNAVTALGHATPDEVLVEVNKAASAVNISTVYRTLELLEQLGLVGHSHLTDRSPTYHSQEHGRHVHLVCRGCEQIFETEASDLAGLADRLRAEQGFVVDISHVTLFGTCASCTQDQARDVDQARDRGPDSGESPGHGAGSSTTSPHGSPHA